MNKFILTLVFFAVGIFHFGCSSSSTAENFTFGIGKYNYRMSDSSGTKLLQGILNVKVYEKNKISGTYTFSKVYNDKFPGFSSMDGEFEGEVNTKDKTVFINTNPKIADSNVFWRLSIRSDRLSGGWTYSVFRGETSGGLVKITK